MGATDQGVVGAGPFESEANARAAGNTIAAELRESMRRDRLPGGRRRYSEADISARVAALRVGYGVRVHPHGGFETRG